MAGCHNRYNYDSDSLGDCSSTNCSCRVESDRDSKRDYGKYLKDRLRNAENEACELRQVLKESERDPPVHSQGNQNECELKIIQEVNQNLKEKMNCLKQRIDCSQSHNDCNELERLQCEIEEMKAKMLCIQEQADCHIEKAEEDLKHAQCKMQEMQENIRYVEIKKQSEIEKLEKEISSAKDEVCELNRSIQCIQQRMKCKMKELEEELYEHKKESNDVKRKYNALQQKANTEADKTSDEKWALESEVKKIQKRIHCLKEKAKAELAGSGKESEELQRQVKNIEKQVENKVLQVEEDCEKVIKSLTDCAERKLKQGDIKNMESKQKLKGSIEECENQLAEEKEKSKQMQCTLQTEIKTLEKKICNVRDQADREKELLQSQNEENCRELDKCKFSRRKYGIEIEKLDQTGKKMEDNILKLKELTTKERSDLKELIDYYRSKLEEEKKKCCKLEHKISKIKTTCRSVSTKKSHLLTCDNSDKLPELEGFMPKSLRVGRKMKSRKLDYSTSDSCCEVMKRRCR